VVEQVNGVSVGLSVPLHWENPGSVDAKPKLLKLTKGSFSVLLVDARSERAIVGHSLESDKYVSTKASIVDAYSGPVSGLFQNAGLPISKGSGGIVLEMTINKLLVEEDNLYRGTAVASVRLLKAGNALWSGNAIGSTKRWGRTFVGANYDEALTNSLVDLVDKLTADPQFQKAAADAVAQ
jgi:hypothetical protein